jgi:hypothetical protein
VSFLDEVAGQRRARREPHVVDVAVQGLVHSEHELGPAHFVFLSRARRLAASVSDVSKPHSVLHFLYVPDSVAASAVASELRQDGFRTEERLGADGVSWLVLACHEIVPTEVAG